MAEVGTLSSLSPALVYVCTVGLTASYFGLIIIDFIFFLIFDKKNTFVL